MAEGLDSAGTEIVLRRAFELAELEPDHVEEYTGDLVLRRETLVEIASEVDLPVSALAAALAERQLGVDEEASLLDRLIGPDRITARRPASAEEEVTVARAVEWLEAGHGLQSRIRQDGVIVAKRRRDIVGKVTASLKTAQGTGGLGKVREITAVAINLDESPGAVCVVADIGDKRTEALLGGAALTVVAGSVVGIAAFIGSPLILVGLPVAAGAGLATSRSIHRSTVESTRHDVEKTIDGVVRGDRPPSMLGKIKWKFSTPRRGASERRKRSKSE